MFTGIVEEIGGITAVEPSGDGVRVTVRAPKAVSDAAHGDSISVSGVCLTVVDQGADWFTADVMKQTLDMSTLAAVAPGRAVNLERATAAHGRLGGHIVQGHIDGTGVVLDVQPGARWRVLRIGLPASLAPLVVDKGSIALEGVSLTVSAVSAPTDPEQWFEVSLIPETLEATTLGDLAPGDAVNLETDILARHVQRLLLSRLRPHPRSARPHFAAPAAPALREASFAAPAAPALRAADFTPPHPSNEGGSR